MDSVTQIALGAVIGEVALGKKLGNKAVLWGGAIAVVPDLDVLAYSLMDNISELAWHRGISHSILATAVLTPVLGYLMYRIHKQQITVGQGSLLAFLALATHILLDCFTTYGTQVFAPFSDYKVSWNAVFIVDPFYTIPLSLGVILALRLKKENPARRKRAWTGLALSSAYLLAALLIKISIDSSAAGIMRSQHVHPKRFFTTPAPFSIFLWRVLAETREGYFVGYISVFDSGHPQPFQFIPRNEVLLEDIRATRAVRRLQWFSDGYYAVSAGNGNPLFHDLRFGEFAAQPGGKNFGLGPWKEAKFMFTFELRRAANGSYDIERREASFDGAGLAINQLIQRISGM